MKTITVRINQTTLDGELLINDVVQRGAICTEVVQGPSVFADDPDERVRNLPVAGPKRFTIWLDGVIVLTTMDLPAIEEKRNTKIFTWQVDD